MCCIKEAPGCVVIESQIGSRLGNTAVEIVYANAWFHTTLGVSNLESTQQILNHVDTGNASLAEQQYLSLLLLCEMTVPSNTLHDLPSCIVKHPVLSNHSQMKQKGLVKRGDFHYSMFVYRIFIHKIQV